MHLVESRRKKQNFLFFFGVIPLLILATQNSFTMPLDTSPTWSTARLLYRAVEPVKDVDFFLKMNADPQTSFALNGTACL